MELVASENVSEFGDFLQNVKSFTHKRVPLRLMASSLLRGPTRVEIRVSAHLASENASALPKEGKFVPIANLH